MPESSRIYIPRETGNSWLLLVSDFIQTWIWQGLAHTVDNEDSQAPSFLSIDSSLWNLNQTVSEKNLSCSGFNLAIKNLVVTNSEMLTTDQRGEHTMCQYGANTEYSSTLVQGCRWFFSGYYYLYFFQVKPRDLTTWAGQEIIFLKHDSILGWLHTWGQGWIEKNMGRIEM